MTLEFSYPNPFHIYGQPPMRVSSLAFLCASSAVFDQDIVLSMILLANFITSFNIHKRCLIFDQTCSALYYDHLAIGTWFLYNFYLLVTTTVPLKNKIYASSCAILTWGTNRLCKLFEFRHPIRDVIHCSMHWIGILGTWFLLN